METDLVYPHGQVEHHAANRYIRNDDVVLCIEVSVLLGHIGETSAHYLVV